MLQFIRSLWRPQNRKPEKYIKTIRCFSNQILSNRNMSLESSSSDVAKESDSGCVSPKPFGDDDQILLQDLKSQYMIAKKDQANKWLDFRERCYIYLYRGGGEPKNTFAGFDLDGTIIKPKGRNRIPKSSTDWQFFSVWTKLKIQQTIRERNSRLLLFTNQNGIGLGIVHLKEVQERIELVTKQLNIPCSVFMAIQKDNFRKPNSDMYHLFIKSFNDNITIDKDNSFYCGDAIGYPSHSDADIRFARTLLLPFITPEKFIRGVQPKYVD